MTSCTGPGGDGRRDDGRRGWEISVRPTIGFGEL